MAVATQTANAKLTIGDPAPQLQTGKWIQGDPVKKFDAGHVYIVEFWATWCGPCVASIPHLNDLAQKFKDKGLIVIGQDVWDTDDAVPAFVKKMGDKMTYRVALDDKRQDAEGFMAAHWWKRHTDNHGIPNAFIINKEGAHRMDWASDGIERKTDRGGPGGQVRHREIRGGIRKTATRGSKIAVRPKKSVLGHRWKEMVRGTSALDELLAKFPQFQASFTATRFEILLGQKKFAEAWNFAETNGNAHPSNAWLQNALAWDIVAPETLEQRNLDLAGKLAERANQAAGGKDASILDTLARVQFMSGRKKEAVATEQKAVDAAPDEQKISFRKSLTSYQQDKLPEIK